MIKPPVARFFIRSGFVWMVVGLLLATISSATLWWPEAGVLRPIWLHAFILGGVAQLIFGVAHWMFPRHSKEKPHNIVGLAVTSFVCINLGLVFRVIAEPMLIFSEAAAWRWLVVVSGLLLWVGALLFTLNIWVRVK